MKITDTCKDYEKRIEQWKRCRAAVSGTDAVKDAGQAYLPNLPGQTKAEYDAYRMRAVFYNATARTLDGLTGLVFAKEPDIEFPDSASDIQEDVDLHGTPLQEFAEEVLEEVIGVGRCGILIDHTVDPGVVSKADAERLGLRPYAIVYEAECVTNWTIGRVNNKAALTRVVLKESYDADDGEQVQYRELVQDENGIYSIQLWQCLLIDGKRTTEFTKIGEPVYPKMGGTPMGFIPFWFAGPEGSNYCPDKPPLLDLVDINMAHYRTMADLQHGRFFCGLPTPYFAGFHFEDENPTIKLGSTSALISSDSGAHAEYLEFKGEGLNALVLACEKWEEMMARLGARMLAGQEKKSAETAETVRIRSTGETSVVADIARAVSRTLSQALTVLVQWAGYDATEVKIALNTDYMPTQMDGPMLVAMTSALQSGAIPKLVYFENLQKGEIIADTWEFDDFDAETQALGGSMPPFTPDQPPPDKKGVTQ